MTSRPPAPGPRAVGPERELDSLATPALLVEDARLQHNIDQVAARLAAVGVALRPHAKTSKSTEVVRRQAAAGAGGFACATPAEVEWLAGLGMRDLLWAHQPVGEAKRRFAVEHADRRGLWVALDSLAVAEPLSREAARAGVEVGYLLEVDTGLGRAGVAAADAPGLVRRLADLPGLRLRGVMTHEGHLGGMTADPDSRRRAGAEVGRVLADLATRLRAAGHRCETVSVGSTPGLDSSPFAPGVTEARPGTYVYYDANQVRLGSATLSQCALTVLTTVVSAQPGRDVIVDAGTKSLSSDNLGERGGGLVCDLAVRTLPGVELWTANEEHGFLRGPGTSALRVGDRLRVVPNHACTCVNMWSRFHLVSGDEPLRVCAVEARH